MYPRTVLSVSLWGFLARAAPGALLDLEVGTTSGVVSGLVNGSTPAVRQFLGIPFAEPPVGSLRFMPPVPLGGGSEERAIDGTTYKPACIQNSGPSLFTELVPEFQNEVPGSEDCLYLNVYTPEKPVEKLPVIIWVCGGGYQEGGGNAPYQIPDNWIQRTQSHIVVTFNYRLHLFGFPGAEAAPLNAGFLDIRLVVEWLRDNAEAFGGDPERMILWGQSAGAGAVVDYSFAQYEDPIITGLVALSGGSPAGGAPPSDSDEEEEEPQSDFSFLAEKIGCDGLSAEEELSCMQEVDAYELLDLIKEEGRRPGPTTDGVTSFRDTSARLDEGRVANIPMITGHTTNEEAAFMQEWDFDEYPTDEQLHVGGFFRGFTCSIGSGVDRRVENGLVTYRYMFAGNFSNITPRPWLGAMHSSDIPLYFGTHNLYRENSTEFEFQTSFAMQDFLVSFAANSSENPTTETGLEWPPFGESREIMLFGEKPEPAEVVSVDVADALCDENPA